MVKNSLYEASSKKVKVPGVGASLPNGSAHFRGPRATYFGDIQFLGHYYPTHINHSLCPPIYSLWFALKVSSRYLMILCRTVVEFVFVQQVTCKLGKEKQKLVELRRQTESISCIPWIVRYIVECYLLLFIEYGHQKPCEVR